MKNNKNEVINEIANTKAVERIIGYVFNDKSILQRAITHAGYSNLKGLEAENYQRMEYLGDALLDFVVADELFKKYPQFDEGILTKLRANVVSKTPLAKIIDNTQISNYILYDKNTTALSTKLKSDIFEAIVAAIYLDSNGLKAPRMFILKYLKALIAEELEKDVSDYKTILYEFASKNKREVKFDLVEMSGPPHDLVFEYNVFVDGEMLGNAKGKTKREAQQKCSRQALEKLGEINEI